MKSSKAMILGIAKIASITARIIALLDVISALQYMINFINHFVHVLLTLPVKLAERHNSLWQ